MFLLGQVVVVGGHCVCWNDSCLFFCCHHGPQHLSSLSLPSSSLAFSLSAAKQRSLTLLPAGHPGSWPHSSRAPPYDSYNYALW